MKIVVIGGTGLIGSKLVTKLTEHGHEAIAASRRTGVDALTGAGLASALEGAQVVVDVSAPPPLEDAAAPEFFTTSTRNLLGAERDAGVGHHVALSVVGAQWLTEGGYFCGKLAQEQLIKASSIPYSIIRATQFFEFVGTIAQMASDGDTIRVAPALVEPIAADDAAGFVGKTAVGSPVNAVIEVAGPEQFRLDVFIDLWLRARNDPREVIADQTICFFNALLQERTLLPDDFHTTRYTTRFVDWLSPLSPANDRIGRLVAETATAWA